MIFLHSLYLWGLLALSVPIIIHFFNFQRPKRILFSNVAFLQSVKQTANAKDKIKNWLVLLMRIAFVVCLVLAFARPVIPSQKAVQGSGGLYVSIYLDNSFSSQNERDGKHILDLGAGFVQNILSVFSQSTLFQFIDNSFDGNYNYFYDRAKTEENLSKINYSPSGRALAEVARKQEAALLNNAAGSGNHLFWVSDFQKSSIGDLQKLKMDTINNLYLLPISPTNMANLYVDSIWLEKTFIRAGETNSAMVRLKNAGAQAVENKDIKLFIGQTQASAATVSLVGNASQTIKMNFTLTTNSDQACKISLDDSPMIFDNNYFFTLSVAPKIKIQTITGGGQSPESSFAAKVFDNEDFFDVKKNAQNSLDYSSLLQADLIVLENINAIDNSLEESLKKFMLQGGSIAVFPASKPDLNGFRRTFGIESNTLSAALGAPLVAMEVPDRNNPFFEGVFERITPDMSVPEALPLVRWRAGQSLLRTRAGEVFLSELLLGKSRLYLAASPLQDEFTNFHKHALFVPIMYKMALLSKLKTERLAWSLAENTAALEIDSLAQSDLFILRKLDGKLELIPPQRTLGTQLILEIPKDNIEAGNYELIRKADNKLMGLLAFNYDKTESMLSYYSLDELKTLFSGQKNVKVIENLNSESFKSDFIKDNVAIPLWRYFVLLALIFLLAEVLLLRFAYRSYTQKSAG
ncbi:MAG: hypothetical protein EAZ57_01400 [Cytophagales bacterium]|nr:MAG: hypothetical protein EAZ67_01875 [Cytophagales bacterium]TAF62106.1 MAG: hypothetical protein EAZ57_01400 [Cytophagales bacterium]